MIIGLFYLSIFAIGLLDDEEKIQRFIYILVSIFKRGKCMDVKDFI